MNKLLILFLMIFCHIVDDFYLQGILAQMKQKSWWSRQEGYSDKYKYDYIVCLIIHSISWSIMIVLPCIIFNLNQLCVIISIIINTSIHSIVDNLKANKKKINLIQDQSIHFIQIIITWIILSIT